MRADARIRILVTHADPLIAAGLAATLQRHEDFEITGDESHGGWDIVVTDYERGFGLAADARREAIFPAMPTPKIIVVTPLDREWEVRRAVEVGIDGYLVTGCPLMEVVEAVRCVGLGIRYLSRAMSQRIADSLAHEPLTNRESEVLHLIVAGHSNKIIARRLEIAPTTVKSHVKAILEKLQAASRTHAAAVAAQRGLVGHRAGALHAFA